MSRYDMDEHDTQSTRAPPRKRRRVVISCSECHRRKQKCDRQLPCGNCIARNKEQGCVYESPVSSGLNQSQSESQAEPCPVAHHADSTSPTTPPSSKDPSLVSMAAALGYVQSKSSTIGLLQCIQTAPTDNSHENGDAHIGTDVSAPLQQERAMAREKYKSLLRQLPSKMYIDQLVDIFFRDINWQYFFIDREILVEQLDQWNQLPFTALSAPDGGPHTLDPELRAFPAVLFQILATALLLVPSENDPVFGALKYAGGMTFEDLAKDYSESGAAILQLFGKQNMSVTTVQAQFFRALFLKYTANVTECWHALSVAIRDAQEIGMHRDSMDPTPTDDTAESALENQWLIQRRRKMYMVLLTWDVSMSVFLGRPGSLSWHPSSFTLPVDATMPTDRRIAAIVPRNKDIDPPSLMTRMLWMFRLTGPMYDILELDKDDIHPKDYTKVDRIHRKILELEDEKPAALRLENPDVRWDEHGDLCWLPHTRLYLMQLHYFSLLALHRRYVFHRKKSRTAALEASINMLDIQKRSFQGLEPASWRNFNLFFGSFDAVVMIASIFIFFPREHADLREHAMQHFYWTMERFDAMKERNIAARTAQGVLAAIHSRFNKAVGRRNTPSSSVPTDPSLSDSQSRAASTPISSTNSTVGDSSALVQPTAAPGVHMASSSDWGVGWSAIPQDSLTSLAPMYPTVDLIFNDLMVKAPDNGPVPTMQSDDLASLQFGGDFAGDNSFWNLLNQFQAGPPA